MASPSGPRKKRMEKDRLQVVNQCIRDACAYRKLRSV
jgi:hypothetical protein